ncbi:protein of unknown function [Denitratisoma oestradiolicum]|uniref:Uncharacterized protein n=1 Tax=Denitratisoma oestradiolicum TaxID=311182 RepID=A0A6S6XXI7_9PROT|nr:protein of unknown function [Denitratisoma oestradiolicum]
MRWIKLITYAFQEIDDGPCSIFYNRMKHGCAHNYENNLVQQHAALARFRRHSGSRGGLHNGCTRSGPSPRA